MKELQETIIAANTDQKVMVEQKEVRSSRIIFFAVLLRLITYDFYLFIFNGLTPEFFLSVTLSLPLWFF